ncbi:hypothetical protein BDF19DRAFT_420027 [Syncephalis fuscata]|nr:hypothetical protein BDF19DRAFT_420027 [Syncephalis fuscata]
MYSAKATTISQSQHRSLVDWGTYTDAPEHWDTSSYSSSVTSTTPKKFSNSKPLHNTWHFRRHNNSDADAATIEVPMSICIFDKPKETEEETGDLSLSSCDTEDTDGQSNVSGLLTPANESIESILPYVQTAMALNEPIPSSKDNDTVPNTDRDKQLQQKQLARKYHHSNGWFGMMARGLLWMPFITLASKSSPITTKINQYQTNGNNSKQQHNDSHKHDNGIDHKNDDSNSYSEDGDNDDNDEDDDGACLFDDSVSVMELQTL